MTDKNVGPLPKEDKAADPTTRAGVPSSTSSIHPIGNEVQTNITANTCVDLLHNIPLELRAIPQWIPWRRDTVTKPNGTIKVLKTPVRVSDIARLASTTDPSTWSSFEEARFCLRSYPSIIGGIGFVFTKECGYFGIDVDILNEGNFDSFYNKRCDMLRILWSEPSYTELSPSNVSGNLEHGFHIICKGIPTIAGIKLRDVQIEFFGWSCFLTFTGKVVSDRKVITDTLGREGGIMCSPQWADQFRRDVSADVYDANRQLDLTDDEVIQIASIRNKLFKERYYKAFVFRELGWSKACYALVGELDRQSGSIEQVKRIMLASPLVRKSAPKNGETRNRKFLRIFPGIIRSVRAENDQGRAAIEFGRARAEELLALFDKKAGREGKV